MTLGGGVGYRIEKRYTILAAPSPRYSRTDEVGSTGISCEAIAGVSIQRRASGGMVSSGYSRHLVRHREYWRKGSGLPKKGFEASVVSIARTIAQAREPISRGTRTADFGGRTQIGITFCAPRDSRVMTLSVCTNPSQALRTASSVVGAQQQRKKLLAASQASRAYFRAPEPVPHTRARFRSPTITTSTSSTTSSQYDLHRIRDSPCLYLH